jgi:hypothetical protein
MRMWSVLPAAMKFLQLGHQISSVDPTLNQFILDYECLPFCMSDLVLIYESVTSSASGVRWLTLHN